MSETQLDLINCSKLLIQADLKPVQGDRFQPTGFADIGAGAYNLPDGTPMLLVESAQSMANRLENTITDDIGRPHQDFAGLPYIHVTLDSGDEKFETTSMLEAHRINSPFIIQDAGFKDAFMKKAEYKKGKPLIWPKIAAAIFHYDPNSLLHGTFLANLEDGRVKVSRSLSSFIEAKNVREVVTGGVKNNPFDPTGKLRAEGFDKDVYSNVPYQRIEYTAEKITVYFNLDLGLLRSYNLPEPAFRLLVNLALYKIRSVIDGGLRLRTACDFVLAGDILATMPANFVLRGLSDLKKNLSDSIKACKELFANPPETRLVSKVAWKEKDKAENKENELTEEEE